MFHPQKIIMNLLKKADIDVDGNRPWDIQVYNPKFYARVLVGGSLALGESYMAKWWECQRLDLFFEKLLKANIREKINLNLILLGLKSRLFNMQSLTRSKKVIDAHYELDNEIYMAFLDVYNQYTCGYFEKTKDLNTAQEQKLDLICKKLYLKESDRVLDIGCGWGGFAKYASQKYGCHVTGITISDKQLKYAKKYTDGLPVQIIKQDYRSLKDTFDKIVIVGMIEHVGYKNYRKLMQIVSQSLNANGLFLLHTIGQNKSTTTGNPWTDKYIFPNGMLPSIQQIGKATENLLVMEDWHNFGPYYYDTLMAWHDNLINNSSQLKKKYSETFFRMWRYYFLSYAGAFKTRYLQLWQIVFSKGSGDKVYRPIR